MPVSEIGLDAEGVSIAASNERSLRWRLTNTGIGFGAFIAACIALHALLPFPEIESVSEKLRFFASHKDEFDTLFIGSSRIYFQISPAVFDGVMREQGNPTRSFNFGIGGMYLPESAYVLEQVLKTKPRHLKWVFVEFDDLQTKWSLEEQTSRRALYWHDWKRTSLLLRKLTDSGTRFVWLPNMKKLRDTILCRGTEVDTRALMSFDAGEFQKNFTNVARASDILDYLKRRNANQPDPKYLGAASDGYISRTRRMSAGQSAAYEQALTVLMARNAPQPISSYALEAYRQAAEEIRAVGAVPIFLVTPIMTQFDIVHDGNTSAPGVVMAFNDPRVYPNLYRSSVRREGDHLTEAGSEELTRLIATRFAQLLQAGGIK